MPRNAVLAKDVTKKKNEEKKGASLKMVVSFSELTSEIKSEGFKSASKKTTDILRKAGITMDVKVADVETKSTDLKINALLKDFGKAVRSETKEINKTAKKQRKSSMKTAKENTLRKISAQA